MSYLGELARGLGSVLNPQVAQELAQEDKQRLAMQQQVGMTLLQNELQKASPEYQARVEALKNERAFREEALAFDGDLTKLSKAAMKYGKPEIALKIYEGAENRQARAQQAKDALDARMSELQMRLEDKAATRDQQAAYQRGLLELRAQSNALQAEIAKGNQALRGMGIELQKQGLDLKREQLSQGKALPGPLQKQLTEAATNLDATERFVQGFKDDYAGYKSGKVGDIANWAKRIGISDDNNGQAQWWQDYELHQSQIRNQLFGSALTKTEVEAWNKSAINPGMDPKQVRENLTRREKLERTGFERLAKGAVAGGYKQGQIEAFTGRSVDGATNSSPAAADKFNAGQVYVDAQGNKAKYLGNGKWESQ